MCLAFTSSLALPTARSRSWAAVGQVQRAPVRARCVQPRRSTLTRCVAEEKVDDQPLDETAMRAAEIHEVVQGLNEFKGRIIDDATKLAKKVRAPKKQLEAALASHPDIIKIDGHIAELEEELKVLGDR